MDLFAFRKPKNELESDEGESKNVPFVPEEIWRKIFMSAQSAITISE